MYGISYYAIDRTLVSVNPPTRYCYFLRHVSLRTITIHTLGVLAFHWSPPPITVKVITGTMWLFITLNVGISIAIHKDQDYYGNTQYCV